jgi:lantibiotic modifying enzyme
MSGNAGEGPRGGVNIAGRVGSVGGDIVGRDQGSVIDPVTALAWSQQVVQTIAMRAVQQGTGAAWIGLNPTGDGGWTLSKLGQDLYGGKPGIALFLAAHTGVSGVASSRELALQALAATRYIIRSNGVGRFARVTGVGAARLAVLAGWFTYSHRLLV